VASEPGTWEPWKITESILAQADLLAFIIGSELRTPAENQNVAAQQHVVSSHLSAMLEL